MVDTAKIRDHSKFKPNGALTISAQYIKDLSFENPRAPYSFTSSEQPGVDLALDIMVNDMQNGSYEVTLSVRCKAMRQGETIFLVELKYAGVFALEGEMGQDEKELILSVHCPGMLFPYARRIISDVVMDGGYAPLMLSPIDFLGIYLQKKRDQLEHSEQATIN